MIWVPVGVRRRRSSALQRPEAAFFRVPSLKQFRQGDGEAWQDILTGETLILAHQPCRPQPP